MRVLRFGLLFVETVGLPFLVLISTLVQTPGSNDSNAAVIALVSLTAIILLSIGLTNVIAPVGQFLNGYAHLMALVSIELIAVVRKYVLIQLTKTAAVLGSFLSWVGDDKEGLLAGGQFDPLSVMGWLTVVVALALIIGRVIGFDQGNHGAGGPGGRK